jgi:hypothetical protein
MSCLSNGVTHRQIVLLCARLLVRCVMGWSTSQVGMDDAKCLRVSHGVSDASIARQVCNPVTTGFGDGLAALPQTGEQSRPG